MALGCQASMATQLAPLHASSWEVSGQFNYLANPEMPFGTTDWHYGWRPAGQWPSVFNYMTGFYVPNLIFRGFQKSPSQNLPLIAQNTRMKPIITAAVNGYKLAGRGIVLHPGSTCETSVVRFLAPVAGQYRVSGQFYGLDGNGTGTQTSNRIISNTVINPNNTLHQGAVSLPNQPQSGFTSKLVMLPFGGALDFEVGCGPNGNYLYGSTGLHAVIERTPVEYCEYAPGTPPTC